MNKEFLITAAVMRGLDESNIQDFVCSGIRRHESIKNVALSAPLPATFNHNNQDPLVLTAAQKMEIQHDAQIAVAAERTPGISLRDVRLAFDQ